MQQFNPYQYQQHPQAQSLTPNAVSINIFNPAAYSSAPQQMPVPQGGFYSMYGQNTMPNMPIYPQNYNNIFVPQQQIPNGLNAADNAQLVEKTPNKEEEKKTEENKDKEEKKKEITPLTDDYVKSLENYLNNDNPKIRLLGAKELMERFKESKDRCDNPSLVPLVNKILKDPSPTVRFIGLTMLQTGYCVGNDETISILKQIQASNTDKFGEDSQLASEILLKLAAPQKVEITESSDK